MGSTKDYLMLEEEFIQNQERLKPKEDKEDEEKTKLEELRGSPMDVGSLEEFIDENHCIVSTAMGPEYYVNILSFVDKEQLEPGSSILLNPRSRRSTSSIRGWASRRPMRSPKFFRPAATMCRRCRRATRCGWEREA